MNTIFSTIKRHPIFAFAIMTYLLSWWSVPFADGRIIPYGPALSAVIVLVITTGRQGLGSLWRRSKHFKAGRHTQAEN